eukprot:138808_1
MSTPQINEITARATSKNSAKCTYVVLFIVAGITIFVMSVQGVFGVGNNVKVESNNKMRKLEVAMKQHTIVPILSAQRHGSSNFCHEILGKQEGVTCQNELFTKSGDPAQTRYPMNNFTDP